MDEQMANTLRAAIIKSGASALQLARETGVTQPTISEFLRGKDIRLKTAQKLASHFGLELKRKR